MTHTAHELITALIGHLEKLKAHNHTLQARILPTHTPNDGLLKDETAKLHAETDATVALAKEHLDAPPEAFPEPPPVDNAHVAEGCEQFDIPSEPISSQGELDSTEAHNLDSAGSIPAPATISDQPHEGS